MGKTWSHVTMTKHTLAKLLIVRNGRDLWWIVCGNVFGRIDFTVHLTVYSRHEIEIRHSWILGFVATPVDRIENVETHFLAKQRLAEIKLLLVQGAQQVDVIILTSEQTGSLLRVAQETRLFLVGDQTTTHEELSKTRRTSRRRRGKRAGSNSRPTNI